MKADCPCSGTSTPASTYCGMIKNWKICIAERWLGSAAIVASPNAPPSRQQARAGGSSMASWPGDIRTPNATAASVMKIA